MSNGTYPDGRKIPDNGRLIQESKQQRNRAGAAEAVIEELLPVIETLLRELPAERRRDVIDNLLLAIEERLENLFREHPRGRGVIDKRLQAIEERLTTSGEPPWERGRPALELWVTE